MESSPAGKHLEVLVDDKLDMSQQCALSPEIQLHPGLHQKQSGQQVTRNASSPLLCSGKTSPGVLHAALGSPTQEGPLGARGMTGR